MMDLQENFPHLITIFLHRQDSHMGITIRTLEDHLINAKISHSIETMEIDLEMHLSTIRMETGETMETFLVLHRRKGETFHKLFRTASQEVIDLTITPSADLPTDLRLVSRLTNKNFQRKITRRHLMWFAWLPSMIPLTNYQISVR